MLNYGSANRDEAVFADPFAFEPDRAKNQQIAFGFGAHVCLGQHLARMEMRILMEELLHRLKRVELAGEPARVESVFVGGLKRLPVRFESELGGCRRVNDIPRFTFVLSANAGIQRGVRLRTL